MKILYTKVILSAHVAINSLLQQIDEAVERRAITSMGRLGSCLTQCNEIISLINVKDKLIKLYLLDEKVFERLSFKEYEIIKYKYLKDTENLSKNFDHKSRVYFRRQKELLEKVAKLYSELGLTDKIFEEDYLSIEYFRRSLDYVKEQDNLMQAKIKKQKEKLVSDTIIA